MTLGVNLNARESVYETLSGVLCFNSIRPLRFRLGKGMLKEEETTVVFFIDDNRNEVEAAAASLLEKHPGVNVTYANL